jgi:hypothetical protein
VAQLPIAHEVWTHFWDLRRIKALGQQMGIAVTVIDRIFDVHKWSEYLEVVQGVLQQFSGLRKIVLLDPDTGIERKTAKPEHVTVQEIKELWKALSPGAWLALYQHRYRDWQWQDTAWSKFADSCGSEQVRAFSGPTIANDVAVFVS